MEHIAKEKLQVAYDKEYKILAIEQKKFLDIFWNKADIQITGDIAIQQD
ncbi:hypothetical protein [Clostridium psychrophilum]|nr:hypothetical protein [Clostridium psychrophilum]MBU3180190.1 hypothetical protein [Clostridium psychrophilum]